MTLNYSMIENLTNEYLSSQDSSSTFNVGTGGTIGIGTNNAIQSVLDLQFNILNQHLLDYTMV